MQIRYDLFLDEADYRYKDFYVQAPVIPENGYQGKTDEMGSPVDIKDYEKWLSVLPTEWILYPFCSHMVYFESTVTDEEILFVGELALDMTYKDFLLDSLGKTKNQPVIFKATMKSTSESKVASILNVDFAKIKNAELYKVK